MQGLRPGACRDARTSDGGPVGIAPFFFSAVKGYIDISMLFPSLSTEYSGVYILVVLRSFRGIKGENVKTRQDSR